MVSKIEFTPQAVADLQEIHAHIATSDASAAQRVISRIRQVIEIFEGFPLLGRNGLVEGTREFAIAGLPYTIVYRWLPSSERIEILTIVHQKKLYPPEKA
ncbi:hypothetical protein BJF93_16325 [Xaviernesmea oryzae]|uniref:Type II toxin-antitoxin system RelE/ParE family toxin n=1 Tax=Xaviernesmea oryzae TaxID=464029 RepID=A0A1Q9ASQ9_9HYPH|nr:type II toxin-antitoxin system RelE/ParE family toxin [Xaviernesmea oryzae]OLP58443.1 hypothetical protein BJF93_16325 [Xaviernesmea oryzae]